jgi:putative ABC transport system permease protein
MALGAGRQRILGMIVARGALIAVLGLGIGVAVATAASRALDSLLFGVEAVDVATYVAASTGLLLAALLASYLPARRASRIDPLVSLESE